MPTKRLDETTDIVYGVGGALNMIHDELQDGLEGDGEGEGLAVTQAKPGGPVPQRAATAEELGIPIGANVKAMLHAHSVSFNGGTISLHDEGGVPIR